LYTMSEHAEEVLNLINSTVLSITVSKSLLTASTSMPSKLLSQVSKLRKRGSGITILEIDV